MRAMNLFAAKRVKANLLHAKWSPKSSLLAPYTFPNIVYFLNHIDRLLSDYHFIIHRDGSTFDNLMEIFSIDSKYRKLLLSIEKFFFRLSTTINNLLAYGLD